MPSMRPDDWTSPDLKVQLALLEDRTKHLKDKLDLHAGASEAQLTVLNHRMQQEDWHRYHQDLALVDLQHRLEVAEVVTRGLQAQQARYDLLADRLRYAVAGILILATAAGRIAPEWSAKGIKLLGLLP